MSATSAFEEAGDASKTKQFCAALKNAVVDFEKEVLVLIKCVGPSVPEVTLAPPLIDESNRQLLLEVQYNNHPDGGSTRDIRYYCFATIVPRALADESGASDDHRSIHC